MGNADEKTNRIRLDLDSSSVHIHDNRCKNSPKNDQCREAFSEIATTYKVLNATEEEGVTYTIPLTDSRDEMYREDPARSFRFAIDVISVLSSHL